MPETAFFFNNAPIPNNALCSLGPQNLLSEFTVRTTDTAVAPTFRTLTTRCRGADNCSSLPAQGVMIIMTLCKWGCAPERLL